MILIKMGQNGSLTKQENFYKTVDQSQKKLVFIEDWIDLKILSLAKRLRVLGQKDFGNLLVVCCNRQLVSKAQSVFSNVKYIFELVESNDIQYQAYAEGQKTALLYLEKAGNRYRHIHYSLFPHLQELFYEILMSEVLIKRVLEVAGANFLILLPSRKPFFIASYRDRDFIPKNGIFGTSLQRFCRSENKKSLQIKRISWILGIFSVPKAAWQFLSLQPLEWILAVWQKLFWKKRSFKKEAAHKKGEAVIVNWGKDLKRHANLADFSAKKELEGLEIVHLLWKKEDAPVALPQNQHILCKRSLQFYLRKLGFFSLIIETLNVLADCFSILKENSFGKVYSKDFFFTYAYPYLYAGFLIEAYRRWIISVFAKFSPKALVTSDLANCIGRIFIFTAREWGVKVYSFSHGCSLFTPWLDAPESLGDKVLVAGQAVAVNIQKAGISSHRISIVGEKVRELRFEARKDGLKTVAIITPMKLGSGSWLEARRLLLFFRTMESLVKELLEAGFKVVIKSHKISDHWEFYEELLGRYKNYPIEHIKARWDWEELAMCDAAIFPGGISTFVSDCGAFKVPVIYIDILSKVEKEILRYDYQGCGAVVGSAKEAVEAAKKLFTSEDYLKEILESGRQFYKNHVNIEKNFAIELAEIIQKNE